MASPSTLRDSQSGAARRIWILYVLLAAGNSVAWAWALIAFRDDPIQLGTAALAYTFGLRHAFDGDHIAAIDNVTRKLMQEGKTPAATGFFFSLGHSTVVWLGSVAVALTAAAFRDDLEEVKAIGGIVGTLISALFLLAIAIVNILILTTIVRTLRHVKGGGAYDQADLSALLGKGGFARRVFSPLFRAISQSWHMYPLGFLFGLGFDTATEIGVLGLSAAGATHGLPLTSILVFPALFTAAMSLADTTGSVLMLKVYGWAFDKPVRKLYYNITMTLISVLVALAIGVLEALNLLGGKLELKGAFWDAVEAASANSSMAGFIIVGVFAAAWAVSVSLYRWMSNGRLRQAE